MRWSSLPLLAALIVPCAWAAKGSVDRFESYHAKASSWPLKVADATYKELTASPRDYAVAVLLTALEQRFQCQLCREFHPEWELLARGWGRGDATGASRTVFATLDFADGRETFVGLGLQTAPVLFLFPATAGPYAAAAPDPIRYDFTGGAQRAEQVHAWLARNLPGRPHPPLKRPINWAAWATGTTLAAGAVTAAAVAWPYVVPVVRNRNVWAALSLVAILLFTSGHMFNQIRHVPYVAGNGKGGVSYFAGGFQNQFGMETQIVAAIYGVLSFATISLTVKVPRTASARVQGVLVLVWGAILAITYSFLLSVFRIKNGGYPFRLPPFM